MSIFIVLMSPSHNAYGLSAIGTFPDHICRSLIVPVNPPLFVFLCHEKMNVTKTCHSVKLKLAI